MKLLKFITTFMLLFVFFIGCNPDSTNKSDNSKDDTDARSVSENETLLKVDYDYDFAKSEAIDHLVNIGDIEEDWKGAEIGEGFYWYNPMIEGKPAYIEFKVVKDGKDQGGIVVSLTKADFNIPEYRTEGKTTYEYLQNKAGTKDIKGIRFTPFDYTAETSSGERVFYGTLSYLNNVSDSDSVDVDNEYNEFLQGYINLRNEIGGIGDGKKELIEYHKVKEEAKERTKEQIKMRSASPQDPNEWPAVIANLGLLPKWNQFNYYYDSNNIKRPYLSNPPPNTIRGISGCTPTAVGIILAYWYNKHYKVNLFATTPVITDAALISHIASNNTNETNVILGLGGPSYLNTSLGGGTDWANMESGIRNYVRNVAGYTNTVVKTYSDINVSGSAFYYLERFGWWEIFDEINGNRPAMLSYNGHSAVIYKMKMYIDGTQDYLYDIYCTIRSGWGDDSPDITLNAKSGIFGKVTTIYVK